MPKKNESKVNPPEPPTSWQKRDLESKTLTDPPQEQRFNSSEDATPFGIFNAFFDDDVINFIVEMTNLYARRDKNMSSFITCNAEIRMFIGILLASGSSPRNRMRFYWSSNKFVNQAGISECMSGKRFLELLKVFHLCDNSKLDENDRMSKVRPFYDMMNAKCLKLRPNSPNLSVDEAMLPYFGRNRCKQRMQNKPVRVGYKMWVLAEESGYVVGFDPYQGAKIAGPQRSTPKTWGLGECVVLELVEKLPKGSYHVFMDNFFTSVRLLTFLDRNNIKASGTLRQNRISKSCNLIRKERLDKEKRGTAVQETASDNSVTVVGWKDSKGLYFASNCDPKSPEVSVQRYCREARRRIPVSQPLVIRNYNR